MKVYIQIGSTRERIEFDLNPSDTIEVLKAKINEDRGIPTKIQRIYKNYQARNEREVLSDDTKVSEIKKDHSKDSFPWHVADEYDGDGNPINQDYLRLYMFGEGLKINIRTLAGYEFVINCDDLQSHYNVNVHNIKYEILCQKGYPTTMQKLYLGDTSMSELTDQEHILSPQICSKICDHGLVLRVGGRIRIRSIARPCFGNNFMSDLKLEIDVMDKVSQLKQKVMNNHLFKNGPKNIHLYIDGNVIQNLEDDKRLCDYNIRGLLQHGLLMKPALSTIYVRSLTGRTYELECSLDDTVESFKDRIEQETGVPTYGFWLRFAGNPLQAGKCLSDYNIKHDSTVHFTQKLLGD